jgi:hypothetical protein
MFAGKILSAKYPHTVQARMIAFASPDWQLSIDGIQLQKGLYDHVYVAGRTVELHYEDYRFVCSFPTPANQSLSQVSGL